MLFMGSVFPGTVRQPLLAAVLVLATAVAPVVAEPGSAATATATLDLSFTLHPDTGMVDVRLSVTDPGSLSTLKLSLGRLTSLEGEPTLEGAWNQEGSAAVVDLEETPNAVASWTADGRILVESLEGEGHTSYVGDAFAIVKAGDVMPQIGYTFPQDSPPRFSTTFSVEAPDAWTVDGPWTKTGERSFQLTSAIPRGFLVADDDLAEVTLGQGEDAYRVLRVEDAREDRTTERVLLKARSFLGGIYGETVHQRFIVVAPDPMFQGGLGSPDGVFLHADADASVVAHEMVHAFQGWQFSREPGKATIWLAEGTAVVHGKLLEVATGVTSREEALDFLEQQRRRANEEHAVDLTSAVYGTGNEPAAYTKGAVVVTALDDEIRDATDNEYTLAHVLRRINEIADQRPSPAFGPDRFTNEELLDVIGNVTGFDLGPFFQAYVSGSDVPRLGAVFPGEASVRILGTEPSPAVAGRPLTLRVALANLDTEELSVELPVLVNGTEAGTVRATLPAGGSGEATAELTPLPKGRYTIEVQRSTKTVDVVGPPKPVVNVTVWPPSPDAHGNLTVGAIVANEGEAPYRGPFELLLDGDTVLVQDQAVAAGESRTFARTLAPLGAGEHLLQVVSENGTLLTERGLTVTEHPAERRSAPGVGLAAALTATLAIAALARARQRS